MKRTRSLTASLLGAWGLTLLLAGCGEEQVDQTANVPRPTTAVITGEFPTEVQEILEATPTNRLPEAEEHSDIDAYWLEFAQIIAMKQDLYPAFDEQPLEYYIEGLSNTDPLIRWYCAYKITDYANVLTEANRQAVTALLSDSDVDVVRAARFANELLNRTYEGEAFTRTADGKLTAYYKYREARYNNGIVYLVRDGGEPEIIFNEPSVHDLKFSPNGRYLYVGNGGRIWQGIHVYDVSTNEWTRLQNSVGSLLAAEDSPYQKFDAARVDPVYQWESLQAWSPEGERFTFFYHFGYDGQDYEGYAVYGMNDGIVSHVMPITELRPDPLADFAW